MSIECDLKIIWFWKYLNCECFFNSFKFILDLQLNTILFLNLFFLVKLFFAMTILWTSECSFKLTTQTAFHRNCSQLFMALLFTKIGKNLNWNFDLNFGVFCLVNRTGRIPFKCQPILIWKTVAGTKTFILVRNQKLQKFNYLKTQISKI